MALYHGYKAFLCISEQKWMVLEQWYKSWVVSSIRLVGKCDIKNKTINLSIFSDYKKDKVRNNQTIQLIPV